MQSKRHPTKYPGVFYRIGKRIGGPGQERVYYVIFKKANKGHEEKVGRQFVDDLTPARAARIRGERIEGKRLSRKESRQREQAQKAEAAARWTIDRLWEEYAAGKPASKGLRVDTNRYEHHLKAAFGEKELKDLLPLDVDRVRICLSRTRKPQTVKHVLALLRRISGTRTEGARRVRARLPAATQPSNPGGECTWRRNRRGVLGLSGCAAEENEMKRLIGFRIQSVEPRSFPIGKGA